MRILQLSDTHLRGDNKLSFRVVDTKRCLDSTVAYLKGMVQKPDIIVLSGDLADSGDLNAYHLLFEAFSALNIPVYALPGNHDRRDRMQTVLQDWCPSDPKVAPHICYTVEKDDLRLIVLDSMHPGSHSGHFFPAVESWLVDELGKRPDVQTLLFMHHPPFSTGLGVMDEPFENQQRFADVVAANPQVRLCFGHMHRPIITQWQGRLCVTAPSAAMQIDLDLSPEGGDTFRMEAPGYLLHHWENQTLNTHVCQIPTDVTFAGPYPFAGSVNPVGPSA